MTSRKKPEKRLRALEWAFIVGLLGLVGFCFVFIPEMRTLITGVTLAQLVDESGQTSYGSARVEGTICGVEPYPFHMGGDQDNVLMCISDGETSVQAIGDRADWSFDPVVGMQVDVKLVKREYGTTTEQLLIRRLKPAAVP
jgi:hypothetical protein